MSKLTKNIVYGVHGKYYDTDMALNYAAIHGGFTVKMSDNKIRRGQHKKEINKRFGRVKKNES